MILTRVVTPLGRWRVQVVTETDKLHTERPPGAVDLWSVWESEREGESQERLRHEYEIDRVPECLESYEDQGYESNRLYASSIHSEIKY